MMDPLIVLFLMMFVVGLFLAVTYLNTSHRAGSSSIAEIDWDAIADDVVQAEIARQDKIGAIKRYRQLTGYDLQSSKAAIDYAMLHPDERGNKKKKAAYDAGDAGIRDLVEDGRLDEAVEIYQKFAGVDAYTARDAVNDIARDLQANSDPYSDASSSAKSNRN